MSAATGWIDHGTHLRVWIDIPLRKNGLPNLAAARALVARLEEFKPEAFDPIEGVSEEMARAALRDRPETIVLAENTPPIPVYDEDEFPGYRCANGACYGD